MRLTARLVAAARAELGREITGSEAELLHHGRTRTAGSGRRATARRRRARRRRGQSMPPAPPERVADAPVTLRSYTVPGSALLITRVVHAATCRGNKNRAHRAAQHESRASRNPRFMHQSLFELRQPIALPPTEHSKPRARAPHRRVAKGGTYANLRTDDARACQRHRGDSTRRFAVQFEPARAAAVALPLLAPFATGRHSTPTRPEID